MYYALNFSEMKILFIGETRAKIEKWLLEYYPDRKYIIVTRECK